MTMNAFASKAALCIILFRYAVVSVFAVIEFRLYVISDSH
jgi:hypothetical protein